MDRILPIGFMKLVKKDENIRSLTNLLASQPLKMMLTQLLVSVTILFLVFSWPPDLWMTSPLLCYEKLYLFVTWNSMQLLNKNCIFLICNGILVLVAKTSAVVPSPSPSDLNDMLQKRIDDGDAGIQIQTRSVSDRTPKYDEPSLVQTQPEAVSEKHITVEESGVVEEEEDEKMKHNEEEEGVSISIDDEDHERELAICCHDDDDDDDEIEKLSTEEVNQKFEDFIRRMKEEFRINI